MSKRNKYIIGAGASLLSIALIAGGSAAYAKQIIKLRPVASGKVAAVNGSTMTLTASNGTTYTVDISKATVKKIEQSTTAGAKNTESTITTSQIQVGDDVFISGSINGNNVVATKILDGILPMHKANGQMSKMAAIGTVSAVSGNTITLNAKNGTSYSVDASNASIIKFVAGTTTTKGTSSTITASQVKVGDTLAVEGTVSGSSITATKIADGTLMHRGFAFGKGRHMLMQKSPNTTK